MVRGGGPGYDSGSRVLDQLEFVKGLVGEAEEERVAVVQAGGNKAVDKDGGRVGREGGAKTVDVA